MRIRIYKPAFDQGFESLKVEKEPFKTYELDPKYWEAFYEFVSLSDYDALLKENEQLKKRVADLETSK